MSLVYSGNFLAEAEVDPFGTARLRIGIHPEAFAWRLEPGATFTTPEAVIAWSRRRPRRPERGAPRPVPRAAGARAPGATAPRPVVLNNWEATYFDFDHDRIVGIAPAAKDLGVELFVLDDGWFGRRDNDDSSLGDWVVDRRKLPGGIEALARDVQGLGLEFGSGSSPRWSTRTATCSAPIPTGRSASRAASGRRAASSSSSTSPPRGRRPHRRRADRVLSSAPIDYVKWDMNRNITEPWTAGAPGRPPGRVLPPLHPRRVRAVPAPDGALPGHPVRVVRQRRRRASTPGCSPTRRRPGRATTPTRSSGCAIQWGTSLAFPLASMAAHVSAVPNHQTGRVTPLFTRAAVAMFGAFGYELDPTAMPADEQAEVARQIAWYRRSPRAPPARPLPAPAQPVRGRRQRDGVDGRLDAIGARRRRLYRELARPLPVPTGSRCAGLDPAAAYQVALWPSTTTASDVRTRSSAAATT